MFRAAFLLALSLGAAALAAGPPLQERVPLEVVLDRAGWYLDYFVDEFENVVAEESYVQDSALLLPSFMPVVVSTHRRPCESRSRPASPRIIAGDETSL